MNIILQYHTTMATIMIVRVIEGDLIESLKERLRSRSVFAICSLSVAFRALGKEDVNLQEFAKGIERYNELCLLRHKLHFLQFEIAELFSLFVRPSGLVNVQEFLAALRPPMSQERTELVVLAFNNLDKTGSGSVAVSEIREEYKHTKTVTFSASGWGSSHFYYLMSLI